MAPLIAAAPAIASFAGSAASIAGAGFSIFKGVRSLFSSRSSQPSRQGTPQAGPAPRVADDSVARRRRRIGRNALILSDQEDILGNPTTLGRSQLTAF